MKAIIDEGVPRSLVKPLVVAGCDVAYFPNEWKGTKNGTLLAAVRGAGYGCLLTCDKSMPNQQNLAVAGIAIVVLPTQNLGALRALIGDIAHAIADAKLGTARFVQMPTRKPGATS